jgi:hypothetical protein
MEKAALTMNNQVKVMDVHTTTGDNPKPAKKWTLSLEYAEAHMGNQEDSTNRPELLHSHWKLHYVHQGYIFVHDKRHNLLLREQGE